MTGQEIKNRFENHISDTIDSDFTYELMTDAFDELRSETNWHFLKKLDQSQTVSTTNLYTDSKNLPSGLLIILAITVGTNSEPLKPIPYEDREKCKDLWGYYYVDFANSKFYICGQPGEGSTVNIWYIDDTATMTSASTVTPRKVGVAIAYKMVEMYYNIEFDDTSIGLGIPTKYAKLYDKTLEELKRWDSQFRLREMENTYNEEI